MKLDNFDIKEKTFIIAELSANHGHDIEIAKKTIQAAKKSGADAIKIQTYTADTLTIDCDNEYFTLNNGTIWDGRTLYDLYKEAYTPWEWQRELKEYAESLGLIFFSTPFDKSAVDFLEEIDIPIYKIASFEIKDIPLIEYVASKGKPIIMSVGIATLSDIEEALEACHKMGNKQIILLKCTSSYPAKPSDANLLTIPNLSETFDVEVGLSDHTLGTAVSVLSIALGAKVIEKHFILDKSIGGPDASFSMEPKEFKKLVEDIRVAEVALGKVDYNLTESKKKSRLLGRALFVTEDIKKGEIFCEKNIRSIRPSPMGSIEPKYINDFLGKVCTCDVKKGTPVNWTMI
ncbi:MAG: pseudaminic acid synthase [Lachnospirales bacterium]